LIERIELAAEGRRIILKKKVGNFANLTLQETPSQGGRLFAGALGEKFIGPAVAAESWQSTGRHEIPLLRPKDRPRSPLGTIESGARKLRLDLKYGVFLWI
jgi:hypothetical protein